MTRHSKISNAPFPSIHAPWKPTISLACCFVASAKSLSQRASSRSHASWNRSEARRPICDFGCCRQTDPKMPDHFFKLGNSRSPMALAQVSRRDFLRQLGRWGSVVPASALVPGLGETLRLQRSPASSTIKKPGTSPEPAASFYFTDVAAQAGVGNATNVFGGVAHKRYLLEEIGCGIALFDYDNDGWLDLFVANGTRFEGISPEHQPSNSLFRNNRDGSFTDVTEKAGLLRSGWGQGCCVGDYDNDGYDDLLVTYWGGIVLYHNNGDGTVTDVTQKAGLRSEEHTSELQSHHDLVCRLLLEKKKKNKKNKTIAKKKS